MHFCHLICLPLIQLQRLGRRQFGLKEDPAVPAKKPVTPTSGSNASAAMPAGPPGDSLSSIEIIRRTLQSRRRWVAGMFCGRTVH
jgi:hypothetical protein